MSMLRITALAEGVSFVALLVAMMGHRVAGTPDLAAVTGPIHGIAFIAYIGAVAVERERYRWDAKKTGIALVASVLPLATFYVERRMLNDPGSA